MRAAAVLLAVTLAFAAHSADRLSVRIDGVWVDWWSTDHAPAQWSAPLPLLASAVQWHPGSRGVEWGEAELSSSGEGWRTRLIVVRINPREQRFALQLAQGVAFSPSWTIESAGDTTAVPKPLLTSGLGVDLKHRDSRVAIGELRDGQLRIVMTRFDALGRVAVSVPLGFTVREMAALMGALGCRRAVSLDGGISSQLQVRDADGTQRKWPGWRCVPLCLLVLTRPLAAGSR